MMVLYSFTTLLLKCNYQNMTNLYLLKLLTINEIAFLILCSRHQKKNHLKMYIPTKSVIAEPTSKPLLF